eukprot:13970282-Alexandrium_andersonii.AAC.1
MDDAATRDAKDFRGPEEPEDSERPEGSDGLGVPAWGSQLRDDITGAVSPSDLATAARAEEI